MKNRRSIYLKTSILGIGATPPVTVVELQDEYIESIEVLTSFQAFAGDTQVSPFSFDVCLVAEGNSHPEFMGDGPRNVIDVGEVEQLFVLFSVRDGGPVFHLLDTEKTKALPQKFSFFLANKSDLTVDNTKPVFWILRLNLVEKD